MTREELELKIEDIIADEYVYGASSIMKLIDSYINTQVDWSKAWVDATINIASSMAMNPELKDLSLEIIAKTSCDLADQLINELKKGNHGHETND